MICPNCHVWFEEDECPTCGFGASSGREAADEGTLDLMIQGASVPSLASLMKLAKQRGVITPVSVYGEGAPASTSAV